MEHDEQFLLEVKKRIWDGSKNCEHVSSKAVALEIKDLRVVAEVMRKVIEEEIKEIQSLFDLAEEIIEREEVDVEPEIFEVVEHFGEFLKIAENLGKEGH